MSTPTRKRPTTGPHRQLARLMIVEDNERLRRSLVQTLAGRASEVRSVASVSEATALIRTWQPELIVLDFSLPDGDAFDVLRIVAETEPMPVLVAISGLANPTDSFQLAQLGVRSFVAKPIDPERLDRAIEEALQNAPELMLLVRAAVGHRSVHEVEAQVRATMVSEALARTHGSRSRAARLLSISRQLLQHILKLRN